MKRSVSDVNGEPTAISALKRTKVMSSLVDNGNIGAFFVRIQSNLVIPITLI